MPDDPLINEIRRRLGKAMPAHSKVLLFGSRGRGNQRPGSDLDLLVIEPEVDDPFMESVRLRRHLGGLGTPIDLVVVGQPEADRRSTVPGTLIERALREGRVIVDA